MQLIVLSSQPRQAIIETGCTDHSLLSIQHDKRHEGAFDEGDQFRVIVKQVQLSPVLLSDQSIEGLDVVEISPPHEEVAGQSRL